MADVYHGGYNVPKETQFFDYFGFLP